MNNNETGRWEAAKRTHNFNQTHATEVAAIPDYNLEATDLQVLLPQLEAAIARQQQDNTGNAANKATLRNKMGNTLLTYSKRAMVKAHRLGNAILEEALDHPISYYTQGRPPLA